MQLTEGQLGIEVRDAYNEIYSICLTKHSALVEPMEKLSLAKITEATEALWKLARAGVVSKTPLEPSYQDYHSLDFRLDDYVEDQNGNFTQVGCSFEWCFPGYNAWKADIDRNTTLIRSRIKTLDELTNASVATWQVPPHVTWSPNYEWLKIGNDDYSFNRSQRSCMEVMLEQYEQNGVTQFDGNITLAMAEIEKGTLLEIFKRSKLKADGRIQPSKTRKGWVQIIFDKI